MQLKKIFCRMDRKGKKPMKAIQILLELIAIIFVVVACCLWPQTMTIVASGMICLAVLFQFFEALFHTKD